MTVFDDELASEFRQLASAALAGRPVADSGAVPAALASAGCFDLELSEEFGGMDLGLAPVTEVFAAMGGAIAAAERAEATSAALDLVTSTSPASASVIDRLRAGDTTGWELARTSTHEWVLRSDSGELPASTDTPWWSRRLLRQAAYLVGLADAGYREAVVHCGRRVVGGQPLLSKQLVAGRLVRLLGEVRLAWSACREATLWLDHGQTDVSPVARAHRLAAQTAVASSRDLVQLLGARGLTDLSVGPRLYRIAHREAHRLTAAL
ncbi:acyl-CoA dehydrogenase family protein [Amycolatopsis sp. NPDC004079]|uniref:acyl-CoA dehydrogenase family protein n=1 Tax=Amycolatopsis sp. NPDC004079 TaxID=3154549 RepID=UPI0033BA8788